MHAADWIMTLDQEAEMNITYVVGVAIWTLPYTIALQNTKSLLS